MMVVRSISVFSCLFFLGKNLYNNEHVAIKLVSSYIDNTYFVEIYLEMLFVCWLHGVAIRIEASTAKGLPGLGCLPY